MKTPGALWGKFRYYSKVSDVEEFSRRYFVMNAFDGILTVFGIILGTYLAFGINAKVIISSSVGACIAMGMSGFTGTFLTEKAERKLRMIRMEKLMLKKMRGTVIERSMHFASWYTAFINGIAPVIATIISIFPYFLLQAGYIQAQSAFYLSLSIIFCVLLGLGIYLGEISQEVWWINGIRMLLIGVGVAIITIIVEKLLGL